MYKESLRKQDKNPSRLIRILRHSNSVDLGPTNYSYNVLLPVRNLLGNGNDEGTKLIPYILCSDTCMMKENTFCHHKEVVI